MSKINEWSKQHPYIKKMERHENNNLHFRMVNAEYISCLIKCSNQWNKILQKEK